MKLTPHDIQFKEFHHSLRGYSEEEVDRFLDEVAEEFKRLFDENISLAEKLEQAQEKVREHDQMEKTIHNTLVAAQKSAEDIQETAQKEAELTRKEAELRAKEIVHEALTLKQRTQSEFADLRQAESGFRDGFRAMLEDYLNRLAEVPVPEGFESLEQVAETEDVVASMESVKAAAPADPPAEPVVAPVEPAASPAAPEEAEAPELELVPPEAVSDVVEETTEVEASDDAEPADESSVEEPPEPGFATSFQLGEIGDTGISEEEPDYDEEPAEFKVPAVETLGERDDDLDIEEID